MIRNALLLVGALVMISSAGHSQSGGNKKKNEPGEVEMTFANGSVLRMALLPDVIEVNTEFGKLSVPVQAIRRIDFGLHLPEGAEKKIGAAVKRLASAQFKEREEAMRELVTHGAHAYPALLQATKSGDAETAKRAQEAIAKIKAKVPAKDLQLPADDKIVTARFTIVGHIVTPSIKAKSEYFGDAEHALAKLRQMRVLLDSRGSDVVVDAGKYAQPEQWLDTGITLDSNATLAILASGEVELRPTLPGNNVCGPRGYTRAGVAANNPFGGPAAGKGGKGAKGGGIMIDGSGRAYPGTLLGRIGVNGDTFVIGDRYEGVPERDGKLYLQIVPSPYEPNSTGSYQVKVMVRD
jgi:hypothetical protein